MSNLVTYLPESVRNRIRRTISSLTSDSSYNLVAAWPVGNKETWADEAVRDYFKRELRAFSFERMTAIPHIRDNLMAISLIPVKGARFLDFGCASGVYKQILRQYPPTEGWDYVGADVDPMLIDFCRRAHPGTRFELLGNESPFMDGEFDIVFASGVLHYIKHYEIATRELSRLTKRFVVISRIPTYKYQPGTVVIQTHPVERREEQHPMRIFNRKELEETFNENGLSIVHRDWGSEFYRIPGVQETVVHCTYLLEKSGEAKSGF